MASTRALAAWRLRADAPLGARVGDGDCVTALCLSAWPLRLASPHGLDPRGRAPAAGAPARCREANRRGLIEIVLYPTNWLYKLSDIGLKCHEMRHADWQGQPHAWRICPRAGGA